MKHLATLLLCFALMNPVSGQKPWETALVFKIGNYTMPDRFTTSDYLKQFGVPDEQIRPGYIGMVGLQERLRLGARWSVAAEALFGFAEYEQRNGYEPCITCDCFFGPCGFLKDTRYTVYQALLPVHIDFQWKRDGRWAMSLGAAPSYTITALENTRVAWLDGDGLKRPRPVQEVNLRDSIFQFNYDPRLQWLIYGGVSYRLAKHTHIGLEVFWNPRPAVLEFEYDWTQAAPPPGVMKNVSLTLRNVLGR